MNKSDFYYELPERLIAQTPIQRRDCSRLLAYDRTNEAVTHSHFHEITRFLKKGDCLVLNDSRVMPARLLGTKQTGGAVEILLLRNIGEDIWECLVKPGKRARRGAILTFGGGELSVTVIDELENGNRLVRLNYDGIFMEVLERLGKVPLPPYIKQELSDKERYQTVYSREPGSSAAPTAGLHFTPELLTEIENTGVKLCYVTLHVGLGTFRPVKEENIENHRMHSEYCELSASAAETINDTKRGGGRVIAVGTTSCRTLESFSCDDGSVTEKSGFTDIFIKPGYKFKVIDGLITNFHLPESTLIMLVSALTGRDKVLELYKQAISMEYRFFSFGDCMFIC